MNAAPPDITELLAQARAGEGEAWNRVVALIYADLRRLAHRQLAGRCGDHTLDTTGLVHECYLRIAGSAANVNGREHFFALAARVMRQVIVDCARERLAEKRGGGERALPLDLIDEGEIKQAEHFVALDDALATLERQAERQARVVECRFFAGLTEEETASALGLSLRSVQREWYEARAWLAQELAG